MSEELIAKAVAPPSIVGRSVMFVEPDGPSVAMCSVRVPNPQLRYDDVAGALITRLVASWNATRSLPTEALEAGVVEEMVEMLSRLADDAADYGGSEYSLDVKRLGKSITAARALLSKLGRSA